MFRFKKPPSSSVGRRRPGMPSAPRGTGVFSYQAQRSVPPEMTRGVRSRESLGMAQSERYRKLKHALWMRHSYHAGVLVLIAILLIASLRLSATPRVVILNQDNTNKAFLRTTAEYQTAIEGIFKSSLMNSNKLTVNITDITAQTLKQLPEISAISIALPLIGHRPVVYLSPATPSLILTTKSGSMFIVDSAGRALISANQVPKLSTLAVPVVNDESGLPMSAGKPALPSANVTFITEVAGQLKAKNIPIAKMVLTGGSGELHVQVSGAPYMVKFNLYGDAREEAGAFIAVKKQLEALGKVPSEYIDVRVETRTYYK